MFYSHTKKEIFLYISQFPHIRNNS